MYGYVNTETGQFGLTIRDVRRAMPNVSIPAGISRAGVYERYTLVRPPRVPEFHTLVELSPVDGKQTWKVIPVDPAVKQSIVNSQIELFEQTRQHLLARSDWSQLADAALSVEQVAAWKKYRQQLRDMEATSNPRWPTEPKTV